MRFCWLALGLLFSMKPALAEWFVPAVRASVYCVKNVGENNRTVYEQEMNATPEGFVCYAEQTAYPKWVLAWKPFGAHLPSTMSINALVKHQGDRPMDKAIYSQRQIPRALDWPIDDLGRLYAPVPSAELRPVVNALLTRPRATLKLCSCHARNGLLPIVYEYRDPQKGFDYYAVALLKLADGTIQDINDAKEITDVGGMPASILWLNDSKLLLLKAARYGRQWWVFDVPSQKIVSSGETNWWTKDEDYLSYSFVYKGHFYGVSSADNAVKLLF